MSKPPEKVPQPKVNDWADKEALRLLPEIEGWWCNHCEQEVALPSSFGDAAQVKRLQIVEALLTIANCTGRNVKKVILEEAL